MVYKLTILERLDEGSVRSKSGSANEAGGKIAELLDILNVRILKHEYDGVKRLAYEIKGEQFAGYDYYEFEAYDDRGNSICQLIDALLGGTYNPWSAVVLRHLCVRQVTKEELNRGKA